MRPGWRARAIIAFCFAFAAAPVALATGSNAAVGEADKHADELAKQATELRRAGKDAEAVAKFKQAYELSAAPKNAAQYGLCLLALSRWTDADFFLAEAVAAKDDPWIRKNRSILKEASETAKSHIGRAEILGSPEGANVRVSGRLVGTLPVASDIPVNEGSVDIEVSAQGYVDNTRTVTVAGASHQSVVIRLTAAAVGLTPSNASGAADGQPTAALGGTVSATLSTDKGWVRCVRR